MIALFGQLSLYAALFFSLLQSVLPFIGEWRKNSYLLAFARPSAYGQFAFLAAAYVLLTIAFATNDFSIAYVAQNSHPLLPLMYRLTAVWGAHEGSILLWILMLNLWTIAFSFIKPRNPNYTLVLAILGCMSFCFLSFLILTSNPFLINTSFEAAKDLNPLLQDPGFVIHPPMLYAGYVGFSVAFAITLAAIINKNLDSAWARITRRFALAAWCFLTLGITLGSWWAYRVLGWGGFWFWDPVENASLLPWLAGTALIHLLVLVEKRDTLKGWAALLALICFTLSLLGTFLVRSGVLVSAHTFANDPARGLFLLFLLMILFSTTLIIYLIRIPTFASTSARNFSVLSRETSLLLNSALLFIAMLTILLGTLYPLILDALHLGAISVGAPYFNTVMMPLVFLIMTFMGLGALCQWQQQSASLLLVSMLKKISLSCVIAISLLWTMTQQIHLLACFSLSLSFWIIFSIFPLKKINFSMALAHTGFAFLIIGIMLSSLLSVEHEVKIRPGNAVTLGPYQFFFLDTESANGPNYRAIRGDFEVLKAQRHITYLFPEKRIYTVRDMVMTKVDINPGIFRDLYIALGEPLDGDYWSVRLYYKPFIRFIWLGGVIMMLGGLLAIRRSKSVATIGNIAQ